MMGRAARTLVLALGLGLLALMVSGLDVDVSADTVIDDHVILLDEHLVVDTNITVVEGGWLDIRGSTLEFDNDFHGENVILVEPGGALTVGSSDENAWTVIRALNDEASTWISIDRARMVRIESLSISSSFEPAVSIEGTADPVIMNSSFLECRYAIHLRDCTGAAITGNTFHNVSRTAIDTLSVTGCTISGNDIQGYTGMGLTASRLVTIRDNSLNTTRRGVSTLHSDNMALDRNRFTVLGGWGADLEFTTVARVVDNVFDGTTRDDPAASGLLCEWSAFIRVEGCTFEGLSRGVRIQNLAGQSASYNNVTDSTFTDCLVAIEISSSHNTVDGNRITGSRTGVSVHPWDDSILTGNSILNSIIEGCTVGVVVVNSTSSRSGLNVLKGNDEDFRFIDALDVQMWSNMHSNWTLSAINATRSRVHLTECSFDSGPTGITAREGSRAEFHQSNISKVGKVVDLTTASVSELHNTTHPRLYKVDASSTLMVWWDVLVQVGYESGATMDGPCWVTIRDNEGSLVGDHHLDGPRPVRNAPVLGLVVENGQELNRTPHMFEGGSGDRSNGTAVTVDRHVLVHILLDDIPPELTVTSPADGAVLNTSNVVFSGRVDGPDYITVSIEITGDGEPAGDGMGFWYFTRTVLDGEHVISYTAVDAQGNSASSSTRFLMDTIPPVINILEPGSNVTLTSDREFTIRGTVDGAAGVDVNGLWVGSGSGTFETSFSLGEDGPYTFRLTATDEAGNDVQLELVAILDTTPPVLQIDNIPALTRNNTVNVSGRTDPNNTTLTIDGVDVTVGRDGRFERSVMLATGVNHITVRAVDRAGNSADIRIDVTSDRSASLNVLSPINGTTFQVQEIDVLVTGEIGSMFRVGNGSWSQDDGFGNCRIHVFLDGDRNDLHIQTMDEAGNHASSVLTVYYSPVRKPSEEENTAWVLAIILVAIGVSAVLMFTHARKRKPDR